MGVFSFLVIDNYVSCTEIHKVVLETEAYEVQTTHESEEVMK